MPANTNVYIQKFLNKYPVAANTLRTILINNVGSRNQKLYEFPPEENVNNVNLLIDTLVDFENHALATPVNAKATNRLLDKIIRIAAKLELRITRPLESGIDDDWIMFLPTIVNEDTPVKNASVLVYRFGFIKESAADNGENFSVGNLGLVSEHSIADGAESLTAELFLGCKAKFILANLFRPHAVPNPDFDPSVRYSIEHLTDPAHSNTTIFLPILTNLLQQKFREIPIMIMHGMGDPLGQEYQMLIGNCYGALRSDGWPSFAGLLATSFAVEDYYTSPENKAANIPSPVVALHGGLPNTVLKGDKIVPMSSDLNQVNGALRHPKGIISSNVTGHIRYFAQDVMRERILKGYQCPDNAVHYEATGFVRSNKAETNPNRDKCVSVVQRAMKWRLYYDPAIHDPHRLDERYIERSKNMKLYDELFSPTLIARYKRRNAQKYQADTEAYQAAFAARKQLPPPLVAPTSTSSSSSSLARIGSAAAAAGATTTTTTTRGSRTPYSVSLTGSDTGSDQQDCDYETEDEVETNINPKAAASPRVLRFTKTTGNRARTESISEQDVSERQPKKKQKLKKFHH